MRDFLNAIRCIIFAVICWIIIYNMFVGLAIGSEWILSNIDYLKLKLGFFWFWVLFFFIGTTLIALIWTLFKVLVTVIMGILSRICPYKKFATISVSIISIIHGGRFIYTLWSTNENYSFMLSIICIVLTGMSISLMYVIVGIVEKSYLKEALMLGVDKEVQRIISGKND